MAASAIAALLCMVVLAACGDDNSNQSGASGAGNVSKASGAELTKLLGYSDAQLKSLKGQTVKMGAILALSGPESAHGTAMRRGLDLAVKDIQAAGGPKLDIQYEDQKSGDPQASVNAARKLGEAGTGLTITSYEFNFGAQLPAFKRYKMLAIDPGGGTGGLFNGQPYAWGFRGIQPDDAFPGVYKFLKEQKPDTKRVANIIWDLGDAFVQGGEKSLNKSLQANGMQLAGTVRTKIGTTDYSDAISKIRSMNPDAVNLFMAGPDIAYFMKQWRSNGVKGAPAIGFEYLPEAQKVAGNAYDDWIFSVDYWDAKTAVNPLSQLFKKHFKESYGVDATSFYEANFYEAGLAAWELALRVKQDGGDLASGDDFQTALTKNPKFKSVYGGDKTTVGEIALDPKTHSVASRPIGVWQVQNGSPVPIASFNVGGRDYKTLNEPKKPLQ
jgi:branched-chain amino acid transport system substrate-binding protein